jgi:hypothetical protein
MRGDQQQGPVTLDDLRRLLAQGELSGSDLAWSAGMPQWMMAGQIPALQAPPRAVPVEMGYYTPMMGMPQRAVDNLRNHAAPRGDTGDWPLDDARVQCFEQTVKLRKRVMAAARLYHLMLLLAVIFAVVMVIVGLATVATAPARGRQWGMFLAMLIPGGFFVGLCVLYYFSWRGTTRSQRWAPLTMFILFLIGTAVNISGCVLATAATGPAGASQAVASAIGLIFTVAFAVVSWRAFAVIPQYLLQPAWCQELIVKANL